MTSTIKVNNIQNQCGANIINENSNTITIGASGDTIALASGATQSGFGREGSVNWQTSSIKTATFTAVSGEGYFVDTSSGGVTVNLPAGSAGAIVAFADYTRTFGTNILTIVPNGSNKIGGIAANASLNVDGQSATFVFVDATEGWINVQNAEETESGQSFLTATGGTVTTVCTNFKAHTFTSPGTFCVSSVGIPSAGNEVSYIVVAGGGGGGGGCTTWNAGGGGGAGGYRENKAAIDTYTASPLNGATPITVTATAFPITVGGGGAGAPGNAAKGSSGSASIFSTVTSAGGGGGGSQNGCYQIGVNGGSGGGGGQADNPSPCGGYVCGVNKGTGNTPPVSPPQGTDGGNGTVGPGGAADGGGGGGGATVAGGNSPGQPTGGAGGTGATSSINGTPTARAGGGGGAGASTGGAAGTGGGGAGNGNGSGRTAGTANTGGGGGGGGESPSPTGAAGGSGIVIIRYRFQ